MHKPKFIILFLLLFLAIKTGYGQADSIYPRTCGFGLVNHNYVLPSHSLFKTEDTEVDDSSYIVIPVVVHVIYEGSIDNIPDESIYRQIEVLNEDFGKTGAGFNTRSIGADTRIRFCLASKDPDGNPTTGIIRVKSNYANLITENEMRTKNLSRWDPNRYLNIWVVKTIDGASRIQGYSYLSTYAAGKDFDGVVIVYRYFGRNETFNVSKYRGGRTTTHEVGHYLNLMHTWGKDEPGKGGCDDDDGIFDTPICDGTYFSEKVPFTDSCATPFQCGNFRLIEDYMDYSVDECMNIFTKGQARIMRQSLSVFRPSLITITNQLMAGCGEYYLKLNPPTNSEFKIIPNPSNGIVYINTYFNHEMPVDLYIYDLMGRLVESYHIPNLQFDNYKLDLHHLSNGIYMFVAKAENQIIKQKQIITNTK